MHLSLFRTSAVRRARVLSPVCDCFFVLSAFDSGWVGGSLKESRSALLLARAMAYGALARGRFGVVAGARDEPIEFTGTRTGGEPSGAHRDRRAVARDTALGPGGFQILGMVPTSSCQCFTCSSSTER